MANQTLGGKTSVRGNFARGYLVGVAYIHELLVDDVVDLDLGILAAVAQQWFSSRCISGPSTGVISCVVL